MQAEILPPAPAVTREQQQLLANLSVPFDPSVISWRVTATNREKTSGCLIPYADQRAYTDRLNHCVTAAGWTRSYSVVTVSPITRMKKETAYQTGKVIVTAIVTIHGLGSHSGAGEGWADDENAMTRAEAQAFKRACTCFGLGRYFYDFSDIWMPLNSKGQPSKLPVLPSWALPGGSPGKQEPASAPSDPGFAAPDPALIPKMEKFRDHLGDGLYKQVLAMKGHATCAANLPTLEDQQWMLGQLDAVAKGLNATRALAERVGSEAFGELLDYHRVDSLETISIDTLRKALRDLKQMARSKAKAA